MLQVLRTLVSAMLALLVVAAVLLALSPWLAFRWGLSNVDTFPVKPVQLASAEQQERVWKYARGAGQAQVDALGPYSYAWNRFRSDESLRRPAGEEVASWVAREHLSAQARSYPQLSRQFAQLALMIWLTQHWSAAELATAAVPIVDRDQQYKARRAAEPAASQP